MSDRLTNMMVVGQLIGDALKAEQAAFDASDPHMDEVESRVADLVQKAASDEFEEKIKSTKKTQPGLLKGMDIIELRLWAPHDKCALATIHHWLLDEYGIMFKIGASSGIRMLCPNKLFYITLAVRKMEKADWGIPLEKKKESD